MRGIITLCNMMSDLLFFWAHRSRSRVWQLSATFESCDNEGQLLYFEQKLNYPPAVKISFSPLFREVFKWLSKVITWLRLLRLVIGLKDSRQFFNQWEAKPKPIAPCTRDFSHASSAIQIIARNCDWVIALFAPIVIGRSNCFGFGFSTVIWQPL